MRIGKWEFDTDRHTYVMGILNVTPDSFSDGGRYVERDKALFRAEEMVKEGADLIDIGGESSRPGYAMISEGEEIERISPVIESLRKNFDIPLSLDTCKAGVAEAGILAGADLINDIWGLKYDRRMATVISESGVVCCLMHNREHPVYGDVAHSQEHSVYDDAMHNREHPVYGDVAHGREYPVYDDLMGELKDDLRESLRLAQEAGIAEGKIILDPGVGFGKGYEDNLAVLHHLDGLKELGFPYLLGASRKSVIGQALDLPVDERLEGTIVTTVMAVMKGCSFVRVHDVRANVRAVKMARAILEGSAYRTR